MKILSSELDQIIKNRKQKKIKKTINKILYENHLNELVSKTFSRRRLKKLFYLLRDYEEVLLYRKRIIRMSKGKNGWFLCFGSGFHKVENRYYTQNLECHELDELLYFLNSKNFRVNGNLGRIHLNDEGELYYK